MSNWNLGNVEEVKDSGFVVVNPGYQVLTVTAVSEITAGTGSKGLGITLKSDKGGEFEQRYYLIDANGTQSKQAPAFKYFFENFTQSSLPSNFTTESITQALMGKSLDVTVGGRRYTVAKEVEEVVNGEVHKVIKKFNRIAPELGFGGWAGERNVVIRGEWEPETTSAPVTPVSDFLASPTVNSPENNLPF